MITGSWFAFLFLHFSLHFDSSVHVIKWHVKERETSQVIVNMYNFSSELPFSASLLSLLFIVVIL